HVPGHDQPVLGRVGPDLLDDRPIPLVADVNVAHRHQLGYHPIHLVTSPPRTGTTHRPRPPGPDRHPAGQARYRPVRPDAANASAPRAPPREPPAACRPAPACTRPPPRGTAWAPPPESPPRRRSGTACS